MMNLVEGAWALFLPGWDELSIWATTRAPAASSRG